jgi:hypothetical protein
LPLGKRRPWLPSWISLPGGEESWPLPLTTREEEAARGRWREMVKLGREAVTVAPSLLQ